MTWLGLRPAGVGGAEHEVIEPEDVDAHGASVARFAPHASEPPSRAAARSEDGQRLCGGSVAWRVMPNLSSPGPAGALPSTSKLAVLAPGLMTISVSVGCAVCSLHARTR